jgi:hypothetical protein
VAVAPDALATHRSGTGSGGTPDAGIRRIKGREARRAHYLLLERFRSAAAARRYLIGLVWVLRLRLAVAWLVSRSVWDQDRAAYLWAAAQVRADRRSGRAANGARAEDSASTSIWPAPTPPRVVPAAVTNGHERRGDPPHDARQSAPSATGRSDRT